MARFQRTVLVLLAAFPILACGLSGAVSEGFTEGVFTVSCTQECTAQGAERAQCEQYCQCSYRFARDADRLGELEGVEVVAGQPMPPILNEMFARCGSDLFDSNFLRNCVAGCDSGELCEERCACFLRELRPEGSREASTRWLLEHVEVTPMTEAGERALSAAEEVCLP